jgi:hypothetical protein
MELPLRDIHLPDKVVTGVIPIGWWVVIGLLLLFIIVCYLSIKLILKPTLKKQARKTLSEIENTFKENQNVMICITEISAFLRRVTISQGQKSSTAGLKGVSWLQLLDKPLSKPEFSEGAGQILLTGPYRPQVESVDVEKLIELCKRWVEAL